MDAVGTRRLIRHVLVRCMVAVLPLWTAVAAPLPALSPPSAATPGRSGTSGVWVVSGDDHSCLLRSGAVSCWGSDGQGQLGDGATTDRPFLVPVSLSGASTAIAAGGDRTCALSVAGAVSCWGGADGRTPTAVDTAPLSGISIAALAVGADASCALSSGGAVFCWPAGAGVPAVVDLGGATVTSITAGRGHACALASVGTVSCWSTGGRPAAVVLGNGAPGGVAGVEAGGDRTCALRTAGTVYCWGTGTPARVDLPGIRPTRLSVGGDHTCALASGRAYCWGAGPPVAVRVPRGVRLVGLAAGYAHTCASSSAGGAYCWGGNGHGQLGDRTTTARSGAVAVRGPAVPPGAPTAVAGTGRDGTIDVTWTAPASLGSARLAGYAATASPGGHACRSSGATHCRITGLVNGSPYTLTVVAGTSDGMSGPSSSSAAVTPYARPLPPADVAVTAGDRTLAVSWTAPDLTGTGALTGYAATVLPGGATCFVATGTGCTVAGLANGTTYTVSVVTVASAGASARTNPSSPATPGAPELPPTASTVDDGLASSAGATFVAGSASTTITGAGFAPGTPVVIGVYAGERRACPPPPNPGPGCARPGASDGTGASSGPGGAGGTGPRSLTTAASDDSGNLTADIALPDDLRGPYTLLAHGNAPGGGTRTLALSITVADPAGGGGQLPAPVLALGFALFLGGLALFVVGLRGRLRAAPTLEPG
jgi:hypothetical protein